MHWTDAQLIDWLGRFFWPFLRIGSLFMTLPVLNNHSVPLRVRVILAVAVTAVVMPTLPPVPSLNLLGLQAVMVAVREILIGAATGFIMQMAFAVLVFAGQSIAYSMGLGFAAMIDPQLGVQVPIVSQVYLLFGTLLFLGLDGHLLLIDLLAGSFQTLPVRLSGFDRDDIWTLIGWSSNVFVGGVLLSLPIVIALLFVNIALGVATRAAPQLNIFSVGFPITLGLGLGLIWVTFPLVLEQFAGELPAVYELIRKLLRI
ncbi:flagellar biosynthetic protein FliR [Methylohalobius crimeensis]|uniref:flagellar biosynthetic protein FliR n=1 Tax=Methylohalobius crimeensis TaxID=244365 RepID=UPI0003B5E8D2|nr:flagellar biosynthetic protein FliR [Methylohalobius crimeensis]